MGRSRSRWPQPRAPPRKATPRPSPRPRGLRTAPARLRRPAEVQGNPWRRPWTACRWRTCSTSASRPSRRTGRRRRCARPSLRSRGCARSRVPLPELRRGQTRRLGAVLAASLATEVDSRPPAPSWRPSAPSTCRGSRSHCREAAGDGRRPAGKRTRSGAPRGDPRSSPGTWTSSPRSRSPRGSRRAARRRTAAAAGGGGSGRARPGPSRRRRRCRRVRGAGGTRPRRRSPKSRRSRRSATFPPSEWPARP
mmetsp:Transcript_16223/g.51024  ORF Transcript_16223/g.51024 Transcript_16223/m.51024 type:complete len:251 (+) Transcript_16223:334-1086(+)